ncbi:signal peptidase I [Ruficoccus amylovorans]|uniref:Signal peptidase I n=1 Tax=Ruficoccus amylovorans TaxID=1804625 RepID=A0A842HC21_9BACT|nr:signal peptidase I [Ruficoccus amylovorans]MBC2594013.1 signal peptidase I [Ruficoccus amylovorans]
MGLFAKSGKKLHKEGRHLVHLAEKVINYRSDVIGDKAVEAIRKDQQALIEALTAKPAEDEKVKRCMQNLDTCLKPHGGTLYPVTFLSENIEMILVAAILAIGVRSFFLQPFKIPTNSMYPTYAGMIGEAYPLGEDAPSKPAQLFRLLAFGASHYQAEAPASGHVEIPLFNGGNPYGMSGQVAFELVKGRKFLLVPTQLRRYTFGVDGQRFQVEVPLDFNLDDVVAEAFFPGSKTLSDVAKKLGPENIRRRQNGYQTLLSANMVEQGEPALDFDILTGDMLFVDRFSYNFFSPEVGDPFVFRTAKIPGLSAADGTPNDQYYIKRLVGLPGDKLQVRAPILYRNDVPIEGAEAFGKNFRQEDGYPGYSYMGWLTEGTSETVPPGYFYAMGDNSPNSYDSRGWGSNAASTPYAYEDKKQGKPINFVPEKEVVGKAIFIFYPFTHRWGLAE